MFQNRELSPMYIYTHALLQIVGIKVENSKMIFISLTYLTTFFFYLYNTIMTHSSLSVWQEIKTDKTDISEYT